MNKIKVRIRAIIPNAINVLESAVSIDDSLTKFVDAATAFVKMRLKNIANKLINKIS